MLRAVSFIYFFNVFHAQTLPCSIFSLPQLGFMDSPAQMSKRERKILVASVPNNATSNKMIAVWRTPNAAALMRFPKTGTLGDV